MQMCVTSAMLSLYKYRGHDSHGDTIRNNMDHLNRDLGESEHGCGRTARDCTHAHARSRGALQRRHARCRRLANPRGAIQPRLFVSFLAFVFCRASGLRDEPAHCAAEGEQPGRPAVHRSGEHIDEPDTTPHTRRGNPRNRPWPPYGGHTPGVTRAMVSHGLQLVLWTPWPQALQHTSRRRCCVNGVGYRSHLHM